MTTQQKAIQKAIEINNQIDELYIKKAQLEQAHAKAIKELDNNLCILRNSLSTVLAIANQ